MERFTTHIVEGENGELVIAMDALVGEPASPSVVLSPSSAVFYRSTEQSISILPLTDDIRKQLIEKQKVFVAELDQNGVKNSYYADVTRLN